MCCTLTCLRLCQENLCHFCFVLLAPKSSRQPELEPFQELIKQVVIEHLALGSSRPVSFFPLLGETIVQDSSQGGNKEEEEGEEKREVDGIQTSWRDFDELVGGAMSMQKAQQCVDRGKEVGEPGGRATEEHHGMDREDQGKQNEQGEDSEDESEFPVQGDEVYLHARVEAE
eukprot:747197-Hanusia_phi.AAC.2